MKLQEVTFNGITYYIDFRLKEIREKDKFFISIPFARLSEEQKAEIRKIRTLNTQFDYIKELDN